MIVSNPSALVPEAPTIDTSEARWASAELSAMIEKLGPDSPVSLVLRQARRGVREHAAGGGDLDDVGALPDLLAHRAAAVVGARADRARTQHVHDVFAEAVHVAVAAMD